MRFASNKLECSKQALSLNILAWIAMLGWNYKFGVHVEFDENAKIFLAAALIILSFGAYPIMLKKSALNSGIMKVIWIQSFYAGLFLSILALSFEGKAPWHRAQELGHYAIVWHVFLFIMGLSIWVWAIAMTVAYSDTITTSLAMTFSLFLGDFGIAGYVTDGYQFEWSSGIGLILVGIAFLWLIKRIVTVNCQDSCGKYCNWGTEGIHADDSPGEHDNLVHLPEIEPRHSVSLYGSSDTSNTYIVDVDNTQKKKKKKKKQDL